MAYPNVQLAAAVTSTDVLLTFAAEFETYREMIQAGSHVHFLIDNKETVVAHSINNGQFVVVRGAEESVPQAWAVGTCLTFVKYVNPDDDITEVPTYRNFTLNDCGGCGSCDDCSSSSTGDGFTLPITGSDVTVVSTTNGVFSSGELQTALNQLEAYTVANANAISTGLQSITFDDTFFDVTGTATDPIVNVLAGPLAAGTYGEFDIDQYGRITAYTPAAAGTIDTIASANTSITVGQIGNDVTLTFNMPELGDLTDVDYTLGQNTGDFLIYTGADWENVPLTVNQPWQTLTYVAGTSLTLDGTPALEDLSNVNITAPTAGDTLIYDDVALEWVNSPTTAALNVIGSARLTDTGILTSEGVVTAGAYNGAGLFSFTFTGVTAPNVFVTEASEGGAVQMQNKTNAGAEFLDAGATTTAVEIIVVGVQ